MKLIVCITAYDGLEILPDCIENYQKFSDGIIICYQEVSYTGQKKPNILTELKQYQNSTTKLLKYETNLSLPAKDNEMLKHTFMINEARQQGASHAIISAVDHFYNVNQFNNVKDKAIQYDCTFTDVETYFKNPEWQVSPRVPWKMPFIFKLYPDTKTTRIANYPLFVDTACKINTFENWYLFDDSEIVVHNYAVVRNNLKEKMDNAAQLPLTWSTRKKQAVIQQFENSEQPPERVLYYNHSPEGVTIKIVPNYFNL